ncbi:hypothetical protein ACIQJX_15545 [Streptomyces griseoviridis]|uniref:hypothetical protein n=1 Tax=Streptomyces griseoviridis TaxID=45398 RepID=UPI003420D363
MERSDRPSRRERTEQASTTTSSHASTPSPSARGIAPLSYATFASLLGVTLDLVIRRTVPAMATTLATFTAVQIAMPL